MSDIIQLISAEGDAAVDQVIKDSARLNIVVNGNGTAEATTEDGSKIPSVRKAYLDNLYFKTPVLPWLTGSSVTVFNQLYSFQHTDGVTAWYYAPAASVSNPVVMQSSPMNDTRFRIFVDRSSLSGLYAPINSPVFTGNPQVPTPGDSDSSKSTANTEWVSERIEEAVASLEDLRNGDFENINVANKTTTKDLQATGNVDLDGTSITAENATLTVRHIVLPASDSDILFTTPSAPPGGITKKTQVSAFKLQTGQIDADILNVGKVSGGSLTDPGNSFDLNGNIQADYLHLQGNSNSPATRPQLIVDGIAKIGTLQVDNLEGIDLSVDGKDIKPRSVETTANVKVGTTLEVAGDVNNKGKTTVKDLVVTGTVTGIDFSVDGQDIKPRSVATTDDVSVGGNLSVDGETNLTGQATAVNLSITTKATVRDLEITGTVTGLNVSVDGQDIKPRSVEADTGLYGKLMVTPEVLTTNAATYTPSGIKSLYDITVNRNIVIQPPTGLLTGGVGGTIIMYLTQDATGGRTVTFSSEYAKIGEGDIDPSPNAVTLVQLIYRGSGSVIDTIIASRR